MPAAALPSIIAGTLGLVGLAAGNVEQKAAAKNNQNQQNASIANAKQAGQTATNNYNAYSAANPAPFSGGGGTVAQPAAPIPGKSNLIQAILASAGNQAPTPVAAPTPAAPPQPAPGILSALLA